MICSNNRGSVSMKINLLFLFEEILLTINIAVDNDEDGACVNVFCRVPIAFPPTFNMITSFDEVCLVLKPNLCNIFSNDRETASVDAMDGTNDVDFPICYALNWSSRWRKSIRLKSRNWFPFASLFSWCSQRPLDKRVRIDFGIWIKDLRVVIMISPPIFYFRTSFFVWVFLFDSYLLSISFVSLSILSIHRLVIFCQLKSVE